MSALKPCPFCGGDAVLDEYQEYMSMARERGTGISVTCIRCGVVIMTCREDVPDIHPEQIAEQWNIRSSADVAALQAQLDAANEGAWEYERQLHVALKSLQEIADMHVGDQPAARNMPELDWVERHVGIMRHIASTAVKTIVADEAAKPKPVDLTPDLIVALKYACDEIAELRRYANNHGGMYDHVEYREGLAALDKAGAQ